jgi:PAS domain S-box-containing protein
MDPENTRDAHALWEAINQHSIVSMADPAGNISFVNDTFVRISGYSREELIGQNHRMLKTDVQGAAFWDAMWKTISSGYVWRGVICNRAKDGSRYWVEAQISPFFDARGNIEKYVSIRTDVTAHKQAIDENALAKSLVATTTALLERTQQRDAIIDLIPDGYVAFDVARRVDYLNPVFSRMTGITLAQAVGLDENAFSDLLAPRCVPARRFPGFASLRQHEVAPQSGERNRIELSLGSKSVLELTLRTSETSSVSQILCFRDVTLETEVARLKNEFLTTAAHELRTPMVSIYGYAELLLSRELDAASRQECLEVVFMQSKVMVSILNDLLDLARIDERRGRHFAFEPVDVLALIHAAANELTLPGGRVRPQLEPPQASFAVLVDRTQTQKALVNVLVNAYKYSDIAGKVQIAVLPPAGSTDAPLVGICITDQGIGMTPEQLDHVFERFYRADTSGNILGTGLGMSIVHEVVTLHGGRVELSSQPGVGTSVTLWLPAYQGQAAMALNIDN